MVFLLAWYYFSSSRRDLWYCTSTADQVHMEGRKVPEQPSQKLDAGRNIKNMERIKWKPTTAREFLLMRVMQKKKSIRD